MAEDNGGSNASCGCGGCLTLIVLFLVFWMIAFGIPVNEKRWNLDLFPPRIWDMNEQEAPAEPAAEPADVPAAAPGAAPAEVPAKTPPAGNGENEKKEEGW
jgi:hypothetical protein